MVTEIHKAWPLMLHKTGFGLMNMAPEGETEVNILNLGANYGWPPTCFGINYDGTTITNDKTKEGISNPGVVWVPSIAPCDAFLFLQTFTIPGKVTILCHP